MARDSSIVIGCATPVHHNKKRPMLLADRTGRFLSAKRQLDLAQALAGESD